VHTRAEGILRPECHLSSVSMGHCFCLGWFFVCVLVYSSFFGSCRFGCHFSVTFLKKVTSRMIESEVAILFAQLLLLAAIYEDFLNLVICFGVRL